MFLDQSVYHVPGPYHPTAQGNALGIRGTSDTKPCRGGTGEDTTRAKETACDCGTRARLGWRRSAPANPHGRRETMSMALSVVCFWSGAT